MDSYLDFWNLMAYDYCELSVAQNMTADTLRPVLRHSGILGLDRKSPGKCVWPAHKLGRCRCLVSLEGCSET